MGPISVYDKSVDAKVKEWIAVSNEVFVELYQPHSGGGGTWYMVSSYTSFKEMVAKAPSGAVLFILREQQFPIRGIVDDALITRALDEIEDGDEYAVVQREFYPTALSDLGNGYRRAELLADLEECRGKLVCLGKEPDLPDEYWTENERDDVIVATKL